MKLTHWVLDEKHNLVEADIYTWGRFFEESDSRIVKQETLKNGYWVSTVFLGLDQRIRSSGKPIVFETMVFGKRDKKGNRESDLDIDRYSTWKQAEVGHKEMVKKWSKKK